MSDQSPIPPSLTMGRVRLVARRRRLRLPAPGGTGVAGAPPSKPLGAPAEVLRPAIESILRDQADAADAVAEVATLLRAHFGAAGACYAGIGPTGEIIPPAQGPDDAEHLLPDRFAPGAAEILRAGRVLSVEDCRADPGLGVAPAGALLAAPLLRAGRLEAVLCVLASAPRRWSAEDAALLHQVADRSRETLARARAEAALRESEARHRILFEAVPFSVIIIDPVTHDVLEVNDHACAAYGYPREAFRRLNIADIDALADTGAIRRQGRAGAVGPGLQEFEARHRTHSGEVRDVLVRVQGVRLGGRDVTYGVHIDITARKTAEAALRGSEARLRLALEAARLSTWEFDLRHGTGTRAGPLTATLPGVPTERFPLSRWMEAIHPDEREAVETCFRDVARDALPRFEAEFRVQRPGGEWAWVSSFGSVVERDPVSGAPTRVAGVAQDITARRAAEQRRSLLMREVDHRAKNALAVVQATLRLTRAETVEDYRQRIEGRVSAIARAQTVLAEDRWSGADLRALLMGELESFLGGEGQRARLDGPALTLPPGAAQPFAMAIHELATNATKYGALSLPGGELSIAWRLEQGAPAGVGVLHLRWAEVGGPPVSGPPPRAGFGARVLQGTVKHQLGGAVSLAWERSGLVCDISLPVEPLVPPAREDGSGA